MPNHNFSNTSRSTQSPIARRLAAARTAKLLATGRFTDTGKQYSADQATADANNPALRMTATVDGNKLSWSK